MYRSAGAPASIMVAYFGRLAIEGDPCFGYACPCQREWS